LLSIGTSMHYNGSSIRDLPAVSKTNWPALIARTPPADSANKPVQSIAVTGRGSRRSLETPLRLRHPTTTKKRLQIIPSPPTPLALPSPISHRTSDRRTPDQILGPPGPSPLEPPVTQATPARLKSPTWRANWAQMETRPRRNANGVLTTTSAFSVVQRATRPTSVVSGPRGLMPTPHESPLMEMTLPQKTIKQPMEHGTTLRLLRL